MQDHGGGIEWPHFGAHQAQKEHFLSKLHQYSFHTTDAVTGIHHVQMFEERTAGKGCDAMCCLRLNHFLTVTLLKPVRPKHIIRVLDNAVKENKSQIVMMYYALESVLFYETSLLIFQKPGHSHNRYA